MKYMPSMVQFENKQTLFWKKKSSICQNWFKKTSLPWLTLYLLCCLGAVTHCAQENGSMWISARTSWGHHWSIFYHHLLPYPQIPSSMAFLLSYYYHEIYISNASLRTQAKFYKGQKISEPNYIVLISANKWTKYLPNSFLASIG